MREGSVDTNVECTWIVTRAARGLGAWVVLAHLAACGGTTNTPAPVVVIPADAANDAVPDRMDAAIDTPISPDVASVDAPRDVVADAPSDQPTDISRDVAADTPAVVAADTPADVAADAPADVAAEAATDDATPDAPIGDGDERADHRCGPEQGEAHCGPMRCCSIYGWCGNRDEPHCGALRGYDGMYDGP